MELCIIGAGYVGLVTAVCLAELGHKVVCVEKDPLKLEKLKRGESTIFEPGLKELLSTSIGKQMIHFTGSIRDAIKGRQAVFICVGTPQSDTGKADLSQVEDAARSIAESLDSYMLIIEKSTVPVNTHRLIRKALARYAPDRAHFADLASNPEFLREGTAIHDFMHPDRIVVGVGSAKAEALFREIYARHIEKEVPFIVTNPPTAELIKHASNSFLAMKISYINMLAQFCEHTGADITKVAEGMGLDKRIGRAFLNAGIGYGGSCFPKDVKAFIHMAGEVGVDFGILDAVESVNNKLRTQFVELIEKVIWNLESKTIAVLGLAFKANTDDIREAPSIDIVGALLSRGAHLRLYDPEAAGNFQRVFPASDSVTYSTDIEDAATGSDAVIVLTDWPVFAEMDLAMLKKKLLLPIVIDGRNLFSPEHMQEQGFEYYSIGRPVNA